MREQSLSLKEYAGQRCDVTLVWTSTGYAHVIFESEKGYGFPSLDIERLEVLLRKLKEKSPVKGTRSDEEILLAERGLLMKAVAERDTAQILVDDLAQMLLYTADHKDPDGPCWCTRGCDNRKHSLKCLEIRKILARAGLTIHKVDISGGNGGWET